MNDNYEAGLDVLGSLASNAGWMGVVGKVFSGMGGTYGAGQQQKENVVSPGSLANAPQAGTTDAIKALVAQQAQAQEEQKRKSESTKQILTYVGVGVAGIAALTGIYFFMKD